MLTLDFSVKESEHRRRKGEKGVVERGGREGANEIRERDRIREG
jgi:hypothetical protein